MKQIMTAKNSRIANNMKTEHIWIPRKTYWDK